MADSWDFLGGREDFFAMSNVRRDFSYYSILVSI